MNSQNDPTIERLIRIEAHVHYGEAPPPSVEPFIVFTRSSPILVSAPHGSRTLRVARGEVWHEEDEYTGGIALLLSEHAGTSVIANVWRSDTCDPNIHEEKVCAYKRQMRKIITSKKIRWVLDLHGC